MGSLIDGNPMVWVLVTVEKDVETYVGQQLEDVEVAFIPVFLDKEAADACRPLVPRRKDVALEVHAVRFATLEIDAARSGFLLFVLDADGRILEKRAPSPEAAARAALPPE